MAEVFGNVVGHWRVHTTADVIQQNDGAALIRAVTYFQAVDSWNYSRLNGNYGASVAGQTGSASTSQGITVGTNGQQNLATKDVWVSKGRGNTNVGFGGYINITGYAAGSSSANGTITIGGKPSHTISYNANGGSGAPGNQTKWYGETLYLSNQKPSRTNYEFLGWSTSPGGTVNYKPGAQFPPDQNTTLYAVWKLTLVAPTITSITAMRCSPDGIQQNDGTSVKLDVAWSVDTTIDTANTGVTMKVSEGATSSDNLTGASGTFTRIYPSIDPAKTYSFTATLTDKHLSASVSTKVGPAFYLLDINATGSGMGIGQAAPDNGLAVAGTYFATATSQLPSAGLASGSKAFVNGIMYLWLNGKWQLADQYLSDPAAFLSFEAGFSNYQSRTWCSIAGGVVYLSVFVRGLIAANAGYVRLAKIKPGFWPQYGINVAMAATYGAVTGGFISDAFSIDNINDPGCVYVFAVNHDLSWAGGMFIFPLATTF